MSDASHASSWIGPSLSRAQVEERQAQIAARPVVLETRGLGKRFAGADDQQRSVLRGIDLRIHRREFITVIGPSGCGKSTLARILAGLDSASAGQVLSEGAPIRGPGRDRGMVFQGYTLFPWRTVLGNVAFGPELAEIGADAARAQALQWLELVGLDGVADLYPHQLSGGMRQRVAIARALANQPRILLMDEPFGALDPQTRLQMQAHLLQLWQQVPITIVFITHDLDEAALLATRVVVLDALAAGDERPSNLREIIPVPLKAQRDVADRHDPRFAEIRDRLAGLVHPPASDTVVDRLPLVRMSQAGDEV